MRALRDFAKANGYSVAREYVDEAESGRIADRPQFRNMIDEGGKATAVLAVAGDPGVEGRRGSGVGTAASSRCPPCVCLAWNGLLYSPVEPAMG